MMVSHSSAEPADRPGKSPGFVTRNTCPACDSAAQRTLFARSYSEPVLRGTLERFYSPAFARDYPLLLNFDFVLSSCTDCGLIYQKHIPDNLLLQRLYESWIDADSSLACYHRTTRLDTRLDFARDAYLAFGLSRSPERPWRSLDFGCGWGEWASMTHAFGAEAWGTELSQARRRYCRERGVKMAPEEVLPDDHFDVININQVFEHLPAPRATLQLLAHKLRPGGVLRVAVPNGSLVPRHLRTFDEHLKHPQGGGLYAVAPLQHLSCFRTGTLVALAQRCGLERVRPTWPQLLHSFRLPEGLKPMLKALVRPWYLRSRFTTDLYFARAT